jgi:hypothetical protein
MQKRTSCRMSFFAFHTKVPREPLGAPAEQSGPFAEWAGGSVGASSPPSRTMTEGVPYRGVFSHLCTQVPREHLGAPNGAVRTIRRMGSGSVGAKSGGERPGPRTAQSSRRVLVAELAQLRQHGILSRSIDNDDIRHVRLRPGDSARRAEIDLVTNDYNESWRFAKVVRLGRASQGDRRAPQSAS